MTPQQRAEALARAWLEPYYKPTGMESPYLMAQSLAQLLLATEAACLEEVAVQVVEQEEELDGVMPDELFTAITGGHRALVEETLRCVVRATKKHIMARLREQAAQRRDP